MTTKYLLSKAVVVATMLAALTVTGCDEKDNPLIINGKEWVKAEVTKTDGGATIVANTPTDVNRLLMKIASDINDAVQAGEDYVITIEAPALESSEGDHTINLPLYDYLGGDPNASDAKIVVNFANSISTEAPLLIHAKEAIITGQTENKVEINLPSSSSGIDLELWMPNSTVTLNGGTINELVATTANNTLIIENGVTVNWFRNYVGNVVVKEGAKILGTIVDWKETASNIDIYTDGIALERTYMNEVPENPTPDDLIRVKKALLKKTDGAQYIIVHGTNEETVDVAEVELMIEDGAKAVYNGGAFNFKYYPIINITGEGDQAKLYPNCYLPGQSSFTFLNLQLVNKLSNVTVDLTTAIGYDDNTDTYQVFEPASIILPFGLPQNSESCSFKVNSYQFYGNNAISNTASFKDCTFEIIEGYDNPIVEVTFPAQTEKRKSFKLAFEACGFEQASFATLYGGTTEYKDFKGYMVFDNSKIGGKAITKDTEMIYGDNYPENGKTIYTIDGADYNPVYDTKTDKWVLRAVEAE